MEVFGSIRFWSCTSKVVPLKKWKTSRSSSTGNALSKSILIVSCIQNRCFKIFDIIHTMITTRASLERITREFIEDCVQDGVIYVEIRTTPRCYTSEESLLLSEKEGIDVILDEMKKAEKTFNNQIVTRLVLSINRSESA